MKYGVREICDVVLKAKATQKVGNKIFYKNEPVIYFDTLKTSSLEGAATTVYAQGGRGNSRLIAWEGERTVTFTMEDALISPAGFMILSGAGLVEASSTRKIQVHTTEQTDEVTVNADGTVTIHLTQKPYWPYADDKNTSLDEKENWIYAMVLKDGEVVSEPYIPNPSVDMFDEQVAEDGTKYYVITITGHTGTKDKDNNDTIQGASAWKDYFSTGNAVLVDYYTEKDSGVSQIEITPDKFGGNYYLEASTLFRDTNGVDKPAEFIVPNCKIQSNFTFTMASSGDPSSFTFTMDAFPDYTRFDKTKKVLAAIQIIDTTSTESELVRDRTQTDRSYNDATGEFIKGSYEPNDEANA